MTILTLGSGNRAKSAVVLTPQCGEHRDDLFLSGHDARKEYVVVFRLDVEGEADGVIVTYIEEQSTRVVTFLSQLLISLIWWVHLILLPSC